MNAILKKFIEGMASCGYEPMDTIYRAHSIATVAMREKAREYRKEFRKALHKMTREELSGLIAEIKELEGGER